MKEHDVKLTLQETEQLCRLYMDCKLTVLEETELQYVLGKMPYSSPCIDEVRMLMGVSIPMKATNDIFGWNKTRSKEQYGDYSIRQTFNAHTAYVQFGISYRFGRDKVNNVWRASKEDQSGRTK